MAIPLISFFLGLIIITFNLLFWQNQFLSKPINKLINSNFKIYAIIGNFLIAIALMLGLFGYFNEISGDLIRTIRILMIISGIFFIFVSTKIFNTFIEYAIEHKLIKKIPQQNIYILNFLSIIVLFSLFLKAFFDANYAGDGYWYHLPFAGRIWGIIPPDVYTFEQILEYRYLGLPLLANFFQGLFWFILQRPEAGNLFCYFSLITLIIYLKFYLKIPFYLATISLLAVPMVHMHSTKMYIDLPTNIFAAITILTIYQIALKNFVANKYDLGIIFGSATMSANMKFQAVPVIVVMVGVLFCGLLTRIWLDKKANINNKLIQSLRTIILICLASLIVFFTCVKNVVVYQNPFYPMKLEIAGIVLNHEEENVDVMHDDLRKHHKSIRWVRSLLEIEAFDDRRPWPWTLAMDYIGRHEKTFGVGGYFAGYVVFNLLILGYISWRFWGKETQYGLLFFIPLSLFTSLLPQAYELRYYMYWMIVLVSLNIYYCTYFSETFTTKIIKPLYFGLVATGFMFAFIIATRYWFTKPHFSSFADQLKRTDILDQQVLTNIKNGKYGKDICLIEKNQFGVLYSYYFHPDSFDHYSITAEFDRPPRDIRCQGKKIVK